MRYLTLVMQSKKQNILEKYQTLKKIYFTISDYNEFTDDILDARIKAKSWLMNLKEGEGGGGHTIYF